MIYFKERAKFDPKLDDLLICTSGVKNAMIDAATWWGVKGVPNDQFEVTEVAIPFAPVTKFGVLMEGRWRES
jgi:hypothetical protein